MKTLLLLVSTIILLCGSLLTVSAQKIQSPRGQIISKRMFWVNEIDDKFNFTKYYVMHTFKTVYVTKILDVIGIPGLKTEKIVYQLRINSDAIIMTAFLKNKREGLVRNDTIDPILLYVLLSDGRMITVRYDFGLNGIEFTRTVFSKSQQILAKQPIIDARGDDLYAISNDFCYISRDSGDTWIMDTAGLSNCKMNKLTLDSNERVYLGTSKGLFTQELISNQWIKNTAFPEASCTFVFVDRKQRLWAFGGGKLYVSSNFGATFTPAPIGMPTGVSSMTDDVFGNVYAIAGLKAVKSTGGTAAFEEIQQGIGQALLEGITFQTLRNISGDSSVCVATNVGTFTSYDQGKTWEYFGVEAESNNGLAKTTTGNLIVSNNAGIFKNTADSTWTKVFPTSTYGKFEKIFKDKNGVLYTTSQTNKLIWKSADNGTTWQIDTLGYSQLRSVPFNFYVDEEGTMHAFVIGTPSLVYTRTTGNSWQLDTLGFKATNNSQCTAWGTDKDGYLYIATNTNYLQKRLKTGGAWVTDTAGLINNAIIYSMAQEPNGTLWAGTYIGAFKRVNGRWTQLAYPPGTNNSFTNSCFSLSVDGAGAVWTQWSIFTTKGNTIGTGVYYTLDGGTTWVSKRADSVTFVQLISIGDTTYGISSFVDGLYRFTRNPPVGVKSDILEQTDNLLLYPNPTNQLLKLTSNDNIGGEIIIFNEIGRIVLIQSTPDSKQVEIDISCLPVGCYNIKAGNKYGQFMKK